MRAYLVLFAIFTIAVSARECPPAPSGENPFAIPTDCPKAVLCASTLCGCVGGTGSDPYTCFSGLTSTTSCSAAVSCLSAFVGCLGQVNNSVTACAAFVTRIHNLRVSAASAISYATSDYQKACRYTACKIANASSAFTCSLGTNESAVCPLPTTSPGTTTAPAQTVVGRGTLKLSGSNWVAVLGGLDSRAAIEAAVPTDLSGLLAIEKKYIELTERFGDDESVTFLYNVFQGNGKTLAQLQAAATSGTGSSSWLTATVAAYQQKSGSSESITVLKSFIDAADGTTAAPKIDSASGATVALVLLAAVAVALF